MKKKLAFALIMGIFTTGIITGSVIAANLGFINNFIKIWLRSWAIAYVIVIPAILIIGPKIQKLVDYLFKNTGLKQN
ncbi:DUF2798 domain-containing protein [Pedobacter punctiformis]|uniref:DUF2798 domain-containing protein n=1 Tax=Pedobacter punctiformis TaxID=3004097 RepID=A0ABT4L7D4_9SPHI|nr:DUF2798 domain-containing protein [Pedobacter sp. HCMS5-2]MCZ4243829.1 DUF2798 domain-containing protein [Pedobacter sp. HCMS5-2]